MGSLFAYGDRLRAEQLDEGDDYTLLRRVVVIVFVMFPIRNDEGVWFDVYRETSQFDPALTYDGKTTIFIRVPTRKDQTPIRVDDFGLKTWLKMFGYPSITTEEDVNILEKIYLIVKNVRKKMRNFFGLFTGGETRRVELALTDGFMTGKTETLRSMIIRALRNRFPNENERFFSSCAEKLEKKNNEELGSVFDRSVCCSNPNEFVETL